MKRHRLGLRCGVVWGLWLCLVVTMTGTASLATSPSARAANVSQFYEFVENYLSEASSGNAAFWTRCYEKLNSLGSEQLETLKTVVNARLQHQGQQDPPRTAADERYLFLLHNMVDDRLGTLAYDTVVEGQFGELSSVTSIGYYRFLTDGGKWITVAIGVASLEEITGKPVVAYEWACFSCPVRLFLRKLPMLGPDVYHAQKIMALGSPDIVGAGNTPLPECKQ